MGVRCCDRLVDLVQPNYPMVESLAPKDDFHNHVGNNSTAPTTSSKYRRESEKIKIALDEFASGCFCGDNSVKNAFLLSAVVYSS